MSVSGLLLLAGKPLSLGEVRGTCRETRDSKEGAGRRQSGCIETCGGGVTVSTSVEFDEGIEAGGVNEVGLAERGSVHGEDIR